MKKIFNLLILFIMIILVTSCGSKEVDNEKNQQVQELPKLTDSEIMKMYTNPKEYIGRNVDLTGRIFNEPEYDSDGVYFQIFADPENSEKNTVIAYNDPSFQLKSNDYVKLTGVVSDVFEGTNAFGGTIVAPAIQASQLEIISYMDAVSPTLKEVIPTDPIQTQYGYSVKVDKVEFAENETRIYLTVENGGSSNFNLYSFNSKIVQNGKQYEEQSNYSADYPEVQTDLMVGVNTSGIIAFPQIEIADFQIVMEASSDNWEEDFFPYSFDINVSQLQVNENHKSEEADETLEQYKESEFNAMELIGSNIGSIVDIFGKDYIFPSDGWDGARYIYYEDIPYVFLFVPEDWENPDMITDIVVGVMVYEGGLINGNAAVGMTFDELSKALDIQLEPEPDDYDSEKWLSYVETNSYKMWIRSETKSGKTYEAEIIMKYQ